MTTDPTFDRRKYLRVASEHIVSVSRLDAREGLAHAVDMSVGGIRFQCVGLDVEQSELLKVTLTLDGLTATVVGQIARVVDLDEFTQEVGLSFVKMDEDLSRELHRHLPEPDPDCSFADRRSYARVRVESVVSVARANLTDIVAQARDVSEGGVRFVVEEMELELGDVLRLSAKVGDETTTAIGQIVRVTEIDEFRQEVAMAFLEISDGDLELVRTSLTGGDVEA